MLKGLPGCFNDLFRVPNESYSGYLLVSSARFVQGSMEVQAALPHLQNVMNLGHSVQFPFVRIFLHFRVAFCVCSIQFRVSAGLNPVIGSSILPYDNYVAKRPACGFCLRPTRYISAKGKTGLHFDSMWYDREYVACHIGEIGALRTRFLLLAPPDGYVW